MAAYFCPHCKIHATFKSQGPEKVNWENQLHQIWRCNNCFGVVYVRVRTEPDDLEFYPSLRSEARDEYPPEVRDNFGEALRSLNGNNPKAAVVMTRSALQAAMRQQDAKGKTLKAEIDSLADSHAIPPAIKDWAHELRDGGNLVAHPEPDKTVETQDAEELIALAESLFEYLYVVPKELERRRQRLAPQEEPPPSE
ncbi:MAG: DUF4145 domain-containing protein [Chloroflexi bacterium]|nr:DUF4145 domain-containing protein [Chloroflexota bacterium]